MWFLALGALGLIIVLARSQQTAASAPPALPPGPAPVKAPAPTAKTPPSSILDYEWIGSVAAADAPGGKVAGGAAVAGDASVAGDALVADGTPTAGGAAVAGARVGDGFDAVLPSSPTFRLAPIAPAETTSEPAPIDAYSGTESGGLSYDAATESSTPVVDDWAVSSDPAVGDYSATGPTVDYSGKPVESGSGWVDSSGVYHEGAAPSAAPWPSTETWYSSDATKPPLSPPTPDMPGIGETVRARAVHKKSIESLKGKYASAAGPEVAMAAMADFFEMLGSGPLVEGRVVGHGRGLGAVLGKGATDGDEFAIVEVTKVVSPGKSSYGFPAVGSFVAVG